MDDRMLITYIIIDFFCIMIVDVLLKNLTTDYGGEQEVHAFRHSLYCFILFMLAGLVGLTMENGTIFYVKWGDAAANAVSLSCLGLAGFFWFLFVLLRTSKQFAATKWRYLTYIPGYLQLVLCLASPLTGLVFYIDQNNVYRRGPLFLAVSVIPIFYMAAASVIAFKKAMRESRHAKKREEIHFGMFAFFPFVAAILQIILSGMPILAPAIAASYYMVFSTMQSEMIYYDALTGMNNRRRAMAYLEERLAVVYPSSPLTVYMLDGNKFKSINDTHGHIEGDAAIVCMADAIRKACGAFNLFGARYGGDEFILIGIDGASKDQEVEEEINRQLDVICTEKKKPYRLTLTVGSYTATDNAHSVEELIAKADERLYQRKEARV